MRYGVMHRNTYINSPKTLDRYNRLINDNRIRFAGQITGVEGYIESAASGLLTGIETARELLEKPFVNFPRKTAIGALALYISGSAISNFQPMNINFGIIEPISGKFKGKRSKNTEISSRALAEIDSLFLEGVCHESYC
jgi:methylenetetrahydrofolate--tRNA-(uracil-5-)-methyltransferase